MIEVQHLTKRYGAHVAVEDLSFTAQPGRIYGFLGPNGAGKTTTMNIMTGYLAASEGTVIIDGKDIQKEPEEAKRRIGYLPEIPPVYTDMTVYEYLRFAAELKKVPREEREDAIVSAMEASEILDVEDRLIRNLSKGYRQRVGLAQALVGDPAVLILDEPTAGLDPEQQREMFDYIRSFKKNHTIILSSHILSDISAIADYVWIINKGRLVASDTPENLQSHMESQQQVILRAQGNADGIQKALRGISRVSEVTSETEADGTLRFTITSDSTEDIRPAVSRAAVYAGAAILSMSRAEKSLEDVFFQLTGDYVPSGAQRDSSAPEAFDPEGTEILPEDASAAEPEETRCAAGPVVGRDGFTDVIAVDDAADSESAAGDSPIHTVPPTDENVDSIPDAAAEFAAGTSAGDKVDSASSEREVN